MRSHREKWRRTWFGAVVVGSIVATTVHANAPFRSIANSLPSVSDPCQLRADLRELWSDHVYWTRLFIMSFATDLPDKDATAKRLLQNQQEIGRSAGAFYGETAGDKLTQLLSDHIAIAIDVLIAARSGNADLVAAQLNRWTANADEMAAFLHEANPEHWAREEMEQMLREHLRVTYEEAGQYLRQEYESSVATFEQVKAQALTMADMMAAGITAQFGTGDHPSQAQQQHRQSP